MKKFSACTLLILLASVSFGSGGNPCFLETGDGDAPQIIEHAIHFLGPHNGFWHYVSADAKTWKFKIVSNKKMPSKKLFFEKISVKRPNGSFVEFTKDIKYFSDTEFSFSEKKITDFVNDSAKDLQAIRKKKVTSFPTAYEQTLEFMFEFKSSDQNTENWLNHSCSIGIGLNTLKGVIRDIEGKNPMTNYGFKVDVNNPDLDGTTLSNKIQMKTSNSGEFSIYGLPMGTFTADLETPNRNAAVAYYDDLPKTCEWQLEKTTKNPITWAVIKNTCSSLNKVAR